MKTTVEITDQKQFYRDVLFSLCIAGILWIIKLVEIFSGFSFSGLGIMPRNWQMIGHILTGPLIHGNLEHLTSNSLPLLLLTVTLCGLFRKKSFEIMGLMYLLTGTLVWLFARPSFHIGISGFLYAEAFLLFTIGMIRRNTTALAVSLLVSVLYGSMIWGIFPGAAEISWESHLFGAIVGILTAVLYRNHITSAGKMAGSSNNGDLSNAWQGKMAETPDSFRAEIEEDLS